MKFLADESFPRAAVQALRAKGFDMPWVSEGGAGSPDEEVLARGSKEERILLTLDKDFGELVFRRSLPAPSGVIRFRLEARSPSEFSQIALAALQSRNDWSGFFAVVTRNQIRMRSLPTA